MIRRWTIPFVLLAFGTIVWAGGQTVPSGNSPVSVLPELGGLAPLAASGERKISVDAHFQVTPDGRRAELKVTAILDPGWHIYSLTQPAGGPIPTSIHVQPSKAIEWMGPFKADRPPLVKRVEVFDVPVQEHSGQVTFTAPIRFADGVDPASVAIRGKVDGQVCHDQGTCIPLGLLDTDFEARVLAAETGAVSDRAVPSDIRRTPTTNQASSADLSFHDIIAALPELPQAEPFRQPGMHSELTAVLAPSQVSAGQTAWLIVTIRPDSGWHVYDYSSEDSEFGSKPTRIAVAAPPGWRVGAPIASRPPVIKPPVGDFSPMERYHESEVQWAVPIEVPPDARPGDHELRGAIGYQTCSTLCDMPSAVEFTARITVAASPQPAGISLALTPAKYGRVDELLESASQQASASSTGGLSASQTGNASAPAAAPAPSGLDLNQLKVERSERSLPIVLALAFLGGFVLNFMPCVLPVIGLKIMAFVQQAGEHRSRIIMLNLVYCLGLLTIFWALAGVATVISLTWGQQFGWGQQFSYDSFTIPVTAVVFVMGLSFLGVWEIPIPGFAGMGKTAQLAEREGLTGAFFKGVVATILATPCSAPGLGTALAWTANKPPQLIFLVFTFVGLGMALPYVALGAFPRLIRLLPRPGAWMETFKQLMGFLLLGTVVYLLMSVDSENVIPTVAFLFGLWFACWCIGRVPITASLANKILVWSLAASIATAVGLFSFSGKRELRWEPFSLGRLDERIRQGHTVLVDFTADW